MSKKNDAVSHSPNIYQVFYVAVKTRVWGVKYPAAKMDAVTLSQVSSVGHFQVVVFVSKPRSCSLLRHLTLQGNSSYSKEVFKKT